MARIAIVADLTGSSSHHGGGRQQAHAGDRQRRGARGRLAGECAQLAFELRDAHFQQPDFLDQQRHGAAVQRRHRRMGIGQRPADLLDAEARALGDNNAERTTEAAQRIDARGARAQTGAPRYQDH